MKIARVCRPLTQPAGTERSIVESTMEMSRRNVDVRIYTPLVRGDLFDGIIGGLSIEEVRVPIPPLFDLYYDLILAKKLVNAASKWADIIILHHGQALASYCTKHFSIPCIPYFHSNRRDWNLYANSSKIAPFYSYPLLSLEARCLSEIPLAFANSDSLARQIREYAPQARMVTIDLGVDTTRFYPKWDSDEGFVLMTGRFHPINNLRLGVEAVVNTSHRLVIAGTIERKSLHYYSQLRRMVNDGAGPANIDIVTPTETELIDYLQSCSLFLSTRRYDYLGRSALEAMACGKPVIAYRSGDAIEGNPPVIECGSDPHEWSVALDFLMKRPEERVAYGKSSYQFVNQKHTLKASVEKMLRAITRVMKISIDF